MRKFLILLVFTLLPKIIIKAYVELSFFIFISKKKSRLATEDDVDVDMVNKLLTLTYNRTTIALPYHTYSWIWSDKLMDNMVMVNNVPCKLGDIVCNHEASVAHSHLVIEHFIKSLPKVVRIKLFGKDRRIVSRDTLSFKHALTRVLVYN